MKFAYSFVFSHSCRCVLVCSFRRLHCPALMPTAHLAHRAADVASSEPAEPGREVRCPGMGEHRSRKENMELGIPVAEEKWAEVLAM